MNKKYTDYMSLGAHLATENYQTGTRFSVWAPHAISVRVVGSFNNWHGDYHVMQKKNRGGVWSLFIPGVGVNTHYKYEIINHDHKRFHKIDPVAFSTGIAPDFSCKVVDLTQFEWEDHDWQAAKKNHDKWQRPVSIYELHAGSWRRHNDRRPYTYIELAHSLVDYIKYMGYTHIELMPIMEHPFDGSWGYQSTGYFAPNARFGHPIDFMYFVDYCHKAGIGVILDWVPGHFCRDRHGLAWYDGKPCYEYDAYRRSVKNNWGSNNFALGRLKVQSFLISSVLFWLDLYHIDGLRVDAVADMLNVSGKGHNAGAKFIRKLNDAINERFPGTLCIAEDSSGRRQVTDGGSHGLGFTFRWNMGWTHDVLNYMRHHPNDRKHHHKQLMFTLEYAHDENFVLSFSHDEMAHGRNSLVQKMPGNASERLINLKLLLAWQTAHPGKKLLFMGAEFAQEHGWRFDIQLEWDKLNIKQYQQVHLFVKHLNEFYRDNRALWQLDKGHQGTTIQASDPDNCTVVLRRQGWDQNDFVIVVANFSNWELKDYYLAAPQQGSYQVALSTDWEKYGGTSRPWIPMQTEHYHWQGLAYRFKINIPRLTLLMIKKV